MRDMQKPPPVDYRCPECQHTEQSIYLALHHGRVTGHGYTPANHPADKTGHRDDLGNLDWPTTPQA